jgi:uncharacterized protein (TIGR02145 family)
MKKCYGQVYTCINLFLLIFLIFITNRCKKESDKINQPPRILLEYQTPNPPHDYYNIGDVITFKITLSDLDGNIRDYNFYIDGIDYTEFLDSALTFQWDTRNEIAGQKKVQVIAEDNLGKITTLENTIRLNGVFATINMKDAYNIKATGAALMCTVDSYGGDSLLSETGFVYWLEWGYYPSDTFTVQATFNETSFTFGTEINGLYGVCGYGYMAYAKNSTGKVYSDVKYFTTKQYYSSLDTITDPRDGNRYPIGTFNGQVWLTKNMAYLDSNIMNNGAYVRDFTGSDINSAKSTDYYLMDGVYYTWPVATDVCPSGWHLPSEAEYQSLYSYLGVDNLHMVELYHDFNYSFIGEYKSGIWEPTNESIHFWYNDEVDATYARSYYFNQINSTFQVINENKSTAMSVRCIKN